MSRGRIDTFFTPIFYVINPLSPLFIIQLSSSPPRAMNITGSMRSRRIVFLLTDYCDGEYLHPPCRFESWAMLQHCGYMNRAGLPLLEILSEIQMEHSMQWTVRYLGVT
ncbi:unnamed protein product, partial [Brassica oleracea]